MPIETRLFLNSGGEQDLEPRAIGNFSSIPTLILVRCQQRFINPGPLCVGG